MGSLALGIGIAYLSGSFPAAYLAGKAGGVELGSAGSGSYGATNVFRILGWAPAGIVLVIDVAKGFLPVFLLPRWLVVPELETVTYGVLLAIAAVLGHVFPVFLRFRGGKGVGTAFGAYLALAPWPTFIAAISWLTVLLLLRIVSLASLTAAVVLLAGVILWDSSSNGDAVLLALTTALVAFVFWTHRANIGRLRRGEERRIHAGRRA